MLSLLPRLLATALLLARLLLTWTLLAWALLTWALLTWILVLLARILVLIAHSNSPFSCFTAGVNASGQEELRGNSGFLRWLHFVGCISLVAWRQPVATWAAGTCARTTNPVQETLCKKPCAVGLGRSAAVAGTGSELLENGAARR